MSIGGTESDVAAIEQRVSPMLFRFSWGLEVEQPERIKAASEKRPALSGEAPLQDLGTRAQLRRPVGRRPVTAVTLPLVVDTADQLTTKHVEHVELRLNQAGCRLLG